jgi:hypothetical protein
MNNYEMMLVEVVKNHPGEPASSYGKRLGLDRSQVRRGLVRIAETGEIVVREDRTGTKLFWPQGYADHASPASPFVDATPHSTHRRAEPLEGQFKIVTPEPSSFDSRLAGPPSTSRALIVPGAPQFMPGDPRGRALGQPQYGAWEIRPASGFGAFADDPAELGHAYEMLERQAIREGVAALHNENVQLRGALAARDQAHAAELAKVKRKADDDELHASMGRLLSASSAPADEPKQSMAAAIREERERRKAEAAETAEARWQQSLAQQKRRFPPREYPRLYEHLDPEDVPELYEDEPTMPGTNVSK